MKRQERDLERWLAANAREQPLAVILGTSWNALSFARSLGRRRVPVLLLESKRNLGSYTRYGKVLALPPVDDDPAGVDQDLAVRGRPPRRSRSARAHGRCPDPAPLAARAAAQALLPFRGSGARRPWSRSSTSDCNTRSRKRRAYRFRGPTSRSRPRRCESSRPSCPSPACSSRTRHTSAARALGQKVLRRSIGRRARLRLRATRRT